MDKGPCLWKMFVPGLRAVAQHCHVPSPWPSTPQGCHTRLSFAAAQVKSKTHLKGLAVDKSGGTQLSWLGNFLGHPPGQLLFHIQAESLCTSDSLPWAKDPLWNHRRSLLKFQHIVYWFFWTQPTCSIATGPSPTLTSSPAQSTNLHLW